MTPVDVSMTTAQECRQQDALTIEERVDQVPHPMPGRRGVATTHVPPLALDH
jgi:hypothetical protein